jgi:hypothetical protein
LGADDRGGAPADGQLDQQLGLEPLGLFDRAQRVFVVVWQFALLVHDEVELYSKMMQSF